MTDTPRNLNFDERNALTVLRKAIRTKPWIIEVLMKDQAHEMAAQVLIKAKVELEQLLEVNRAFIAASSKLVKHDKE